MFKVKVKLRNEEEVIILYEIVYFTTIFNYFGTQGIFVNDKRNFEWKDIEWVKISAYKNM